MNKQAKWIPLADVLPESGERILIWGTHYCGTEPACWTGYLSDIGILADDDYHALINPTHWMPLPNPPISPKENKPE